MGGLAPFPCVCAAAAAACCSPVGDATARGRMPFEASSLSPRCLLVCSVADRACAGPGLITAPIFKAAVMWGLQVLLLFGAHGCSADCGGQDRSDGHCQPAWPPCAGVDRGRHPSDQLDVSGAQEGQVSAVLCLEACWGRFLAAGSLDGQGRGVLAVPCCCRTALCQPAHSGPNLG